MLRAHEQVLWQRGSVFSTAGWQFVVTAVELFFGSVADIILLHRFQDCSILLAHDIRCCYFPAPYADARGDKYRSFRAKPLFLDHKR